jgi:hypothetical protein
MFVKPLLTFRGGDGFAFTFPKRLFLGRRFWTFGLFRVPADGTPIWSAILYAVAQSDPHSAY